MENKTEKKVTPSYQNRVSTGLAMLRGNLPEDIDERIERSWERRREEESERTKEL